MEKSNMTTEFAFLLVTDTHFRGTNFSVRHDYVGECEFVFDKIKETILEHLGKDRKVVLIFMGDVFHDSFSGVESALYWNNKIMELIFLSHETFLLVGNHEYTFARDNPIWSLVREVESDKVRGTKTSRSWGAKGPLNFLRVVDALEMGNLRFYFNHYGAPITQPLKDGMVTVGLFHLDLYSKKMVEDSKLSYGIDIYEHTPTYFDGEIPVLEGYDYAVFGHNHLTYGTWKFKHPVTDSECVLMNLASLGRTNHREVNDSFRERTIPSFIVRGDMFIGIEETKFELWDRATSVNEERVIKEQTKRAEMKEKRELKTHIKLVDDPIENIKMRIKDRSGGLNLAIVENILVGKIESFEISMIKGDVVYAEE